MENNSEPNRNSLLYKKRSWLFVVLLFAILLGILWLIQKTTPTKLLTEYVPPVRVDVTDLPEGETPESLPEDLPIEEGAAIVQSFTAEKEDGSKQATIKYVSQKEISENVVIYLQYLNSKNLGEVDLNEQEDLAVLKTFSEADGRMIVTIARHDQTGEITVDITKTGF